MGVEDRSVFELKVVQPTRTDSYGKASEQVIDFYLPDELLKPLIVLIHGGFWRPEFDRTHLSPLAQALATSGWPVALIEYRRIIGNPDATIADIESAIVRLTGEFGQVILIGHSAGGHLALLAGNRFPVVGVIALAPITDLIRAEELDLDEGAVSDFLGAPATLRSDLNPIQINAPKMPVQLLHGADDLRVPIELSRNYISHMNSNDIEFTEFPELGHFEFIDPKHGIYQVLCEKLRILDDRFHP